VRKHIDVVRWRDRDRDLEFARQVGLAVDRLDHVSLAAGDAFAVEPNLAVGRRARRQMIGDGASEIRRGGVRARCMRIGDCTSRCG
jgi:hypothetical protein